MAQKSLAQTLKEKADDKANSSEGWFSSATSKFEEAGDLYHQAADAFKLEKQFREAGDAFSREAECHEKCQDRNEAADAWWNAAKAYKKGHPHLAIRALEQSVTNLIRLEQQRRAADRQKEIAQIYLADLVDLHRAIESFLRAGEWYADGDATPQSRMANSCNKEAADLLADLGDYRSAIRCYERIADSSLTSDITKYSVKTYWLRALFCALAMGDTATAKQNVNKYSQQDDKFSSTQEAKLANALIVAVEAGDTELFSEAVVEFDQTTKLNDWQTNILLKIKRGIAEDGGGLQ
ncbi:hypothetical protein AX16_007683 [Volvariella volvacea WC 439]|nr:hypothetical protein AX16_007683 [Volvariella volvacea WC 439]